jgi:hypothetical protein
MHAAQTRMAVTSRHAPTMTPAPPRTRPTHTRSRQLVPFLSQHLVVSGRIQYHRLHWRSKLRGLPGRLQQRQLLLVLFVGAADVGVNAVLVLERAVGVPGRYACVCGSEPGATAAGGLGSVGLWPPGSSAWRRRTAWCPWAWRPSRVVQHAKGAWDHGVGVGLKRNPWVDAKGARNHKSPVTGPQGPAGAWLNRDRRVSCCTSASQPFSPS